MKEVEIQFSLFTPGCPIKDTWCLDLLIEEVMEAIWRQPDDNGITLECVSQCVYKDNIILEYRNMTVWAPQGAHGP